MQDLIILSIILMVIGLFFKHVMVIGIALLLLVIAYACAKFLWIVIVGVADFLWKKLVFALKALIQHLES